MLKKMKKKLKLPFHQLEKEFPIIMSREDLKSILGGTYGGPSYDWDSADGFLNNFQEMANAGLFNYTGSGNFSGEYDLSSLSGSGSAAPNVNFFGNSGSGSGTSAWSFGSGSSSSSGIYIGSANISGSTASPAPIGIKFNGLDATYTQPGLTGSKIFNLSLPSGYNFKFEYKPDVQPGGTNRSFNFSFSKSF